VPPARSLPPPPAHPAGPEDPEDQQRARCSSCDVFQVCLLRSVRCSKTGGWPAPSWELDTLRGQGALVEARRASPAAPGMRRTPGGMHRSRRWSARHHAHRPTQRLPALPGRRVRQRLTPTRRGGHPPVQACPGPGRRDVTPVGARRGQTDGGNWPYADHAIAASDGPRADWPALPGRRVRQRLTPTGRGRCANPCRTNAAPATYRPPLVGARRCLARRAAGAATPVTDTPVAITTAPPRSAGDGGLCRPYRAGGSGTT